MFLVFYILHNDNRSSYVSGEQFPKSCGQQIKYYHPNLLSYSKLKNPRGLECELYKQHISHIGPLSLCAEKLQQM